MRSYILIFIGLFIVPAARPAPWVQENGHIYARLAASSEQLEGLAASRVDAYGEYGLTPNWTLTGKAEMVRFDGAADFDNESASISIRRGFDFTRGFVASLETGVLSGGALSNQNSCETVGLESRSSLGWSGKLAKQNTFIFSEFAGRFHDNCTRQRTEIGFGQQTFGDFWLINQAWFERGSDKARSDKIQSELLWRQERFDLSVGYREEFGGQFEEEAVFIAAVRRF